MTQSSPEPPQRPNLRGSLWRFLRRPSTLIVGSLTVVGIGVVGYFGTNYVARERLSPLLERELSKLLQRPVKIGRVEEFWFNRIRLGPSVIPPTATDPDTISIRAIEVGINPFPLLFGQPLPIDVTLIDPDIYLEQEKNGRWIALDLPKGGEPGQRSPIQLDIRAKIEKGDIDLKPYALRQPVKIAVDGTGRFTDHKDQPLQYDLDASILGSKVQIQGETALKTGKSQTTLVIDRLALGNLFALFPQSKFQVTQGMANADVTLDLPSFDQIEGTRGTGQLSVTGVTGQVKPFQYPIQLDTDIDFQGQKVIFRQAIARIGKIQTRITGDIDWQKGYNLDVALDNVDIEQLLKILYSSQPIPLAGEARSRFRVTGNIDAPLLAGTIANTKPLTLAKIPFRSFTTDFKTDLNTLSLDKTTILPLAGGSIVGNGKLQLNLLQSLQNNQKIDGTKMPLTFTARANLPTRQVIAPYVRLDPAVNIANLDARAKISGTLGLPSALLNWQIADAPKPSAIALSGRGVVRLGTARLNLTDTVIKTNGGALNLTGGADFQTKAIQANIRGNTFSLTPFLPFACDNLPDLCPSLQNLAPLQIKTADIRLRGKFDRLSLATLDGIANLNLQARSSTFLINSQVSQGNVTARAIAEGLPLAPFLPDLPTRAQLTRAQVTIAGSLPQLLENKANPLNTWRGFGDFQVAVDNNPLLATLRLDRGFLQGNVNTSGIALNPFAPGLAVPVRLGATRVTFAGAVDPVVKNVRSGLQTWQGRGNIEVFVNDRPLQTNATLNRGILTGAIDTDGFSLAPFLPNLAVPVRLGRTRLDFTGAIAPLLAGKMPDIATLSARGNMGLLVSGSPVNTDIRLNNGIFNTTTRLNSLRLDRLLPNLPIPVGLDRARIDASGNLKELITSFQRNRLDFRSVTAMVDSQLAIARGTVRATARVNNNLWQTQIGASALDTSFLVKALTRQKLTNLPKLNANADLGGNLDDLFRGTVPIRVRTLSARAGENWLETRGNLLVTGLNQKADIANVDLTVNARSDFGRFPLQKIVSAGNFDRRLLPSSLSIAGIGQFRGQVTGKNLISAVRSPGSVRVKGEVSLANFGLNDRFFEPQLRGTFQAGTGENIALDLRGKEDIIALSLDPCVRANCLAPYLPLAFTIQQTYGSRSPLIVRGQRQGERLIASIEGFSLELLKISPVAAYTLPGFLAGDLSANLDINLFTLDGQGQVRIDRPGIGKRRAEAIAATFLYRDGIAQLTDGSLQTGQSRYDVSGLYNFRTGEIQGNLKVDRGYIQDLLLALRISDVDSLLRFFSPPNYARARQIPAASVGVPKGPLSAQVNLLATIQEKIKEMADRRDFVGVPTELDLRGVYRANIAIGGTIRDPNLSLQFQGDRWEWRPQTPTVDIVDPLGVVTTSTQLIPIDEITLNLKANRRVLEIQPVQVISRGSRVFASGSFSLEKLNATFGTENFSLDLVRNFVQLPLDVSGNLNTNGTLTGTLFNPQVTGNFTFANGAINARAIEEAIAGIFTYQNARFDIRTTAPEAIQLYASIPYPALPGNDRLRVQGKLGTKALELVEAITQNAIDWSGGEGEVLLDATGRVDTTQGFTVKDLVANGLIELRNATIRSAAFPEALTVNGRIGLTPESLTVQYLEGSFANRQLSVVGTLPFFQPIAANPNPLTVTIQQGEVNIENLYQGSIDGQAIVTGTIQQPVIGGEVRLSRGQITNPQPTDKALDEVDRVARNWIQPIATSNNGFTPRLENFQVILNGLSIAQEPLYQFDFSGALTLNGPLARPQQLRPDGVITLDRGRVSYLDTRFLLNRRNENTIVFTPERGLLNPQIDIQLRTILTEFSQFRDFEFARRTGEFPSNEIPDDSLNRVRRIDVTLSIEGELSRLLPNLGNNMDRVCRLRPNGLPFPKTSDYTREELDKLATCIRTIALARGADQQLLYSPMIQLTSSPPRSEGEIVRLLGDQVLSFFDQLQDKNTEQLIQYGVVQLVIPTLAQNILYDVENTLGNAIGATDFNILPNLESVYRVDKKAFVRFSYDYTYNEFTIRYETRF